MPFKDIGVFVFILALFSLFNIKNKRTLFFYILIIIGSLIITGSFVYYILWKFVPGFSAMHHVIRGLFIVIFGISVLAALGANILFNKLEVKYKLTKKKLNIIYIILVILLVTDVGILVYKEKASHTTKYATYFGPTYEEMIKQNELLQYLSKQPGIFRIENIGSTGHSGLTMTYLTPLGLSRLYGATSIWIPEYFNVYLSVAHNAQAKFWGMLNAKYVYYKDTVNITGFKFLRKFNNCTICVEDPIQDQGISGPYLYLNEYYLPRAYMADYSILIAGDKEQVDQTTYALMLNENFDPSNTVIVMNYGLANDLDFLKKFNAVVLTQGSVNENSGFILKQYVNDGGILLPNIVEGKSSVSQEDINGLLSSFKGDYANVKEINFTYYSPNKRIIGLKGEKGWMVLAEKFHMFEGWEPNLNNVKKVNYRANGINTAVYLEGDSGDLIFKYSPKSFRKGAIIGGFTLILIIIFFVGGYIQRKLVLPTNKDSS